MRYRMHKLAAHVGDHFCNTTLHFSPQKCSAKACEDGTCGTDMSRPHTIHKCQEVRCVRKCFMERCQEYCSCSDHFHLQKDTFDPIVRKRLQSYLAP